ncbi:MAG: hypothetical protein HY043_20570 [Verrucomicrobia bacterium]|nr:hypothetical protein [Verrucomicrobiota bacterium]
MNADAKKSLVLNGSAIVFVALAGAFLLDLWGRPVATVPIVPVAPDFTNTATVRLSAAELVRTGGDASGLDCYVCHEKGKTPVIHFGTNNLVILPKEHEDLVMRHGRNDRNDNCYNCHDADNLDMLKTRDGHKSKITESSRLCGSCHGPTYRDWEVGIHGRTSGFWDRQRGAMVRQDCTSCHDPHSPAFPAMKPGPRPNQLHPEKDVAENGKETH